MTARHDFARLTATVERGFPLAMTVAFVSSGLLFLGAKIFAGFLGDSAASLLLMTLLIWFHGIFIIALLWKQIRSSAHIVSCVCRPGLLGGAILSVPIGLFAVLDGAAGAYLCADGALVHGPSVPDLPWLWIGWLTLAITGLPARCAGLAIGEQPRLIPLGRRMLLLLPFMPLIVILGSLFEWRTIDCSRPFEGFGLFEGGLFLLPSLALFWFISSFSLASLSAAFVSGGTGGKSGD